MCCNCWCKRCGRFYWQKGKKAFEYANKQNIKYVMVVGDNEIESGNYSITDMAKRLVVATGLLDLKSALIE